MRLKVDGEQKLSEDNRWVKYKTANALPTTETGQI